MGLSRASHLFRDPCAFLVGWGSPVWLGKRRMYWILDNNIYIIYEYIYLIYISFWLLSFFFYFVCFVLFSCASILLATTKWSYTRLKN